MKKIILLILIISGFCIHDAHAQYVDAPSSQVQLISHKSAVTPGESVLLGFDIVLDEHWHIYWTNPGDSGAHARVKWLAPEKGDFTPLQFPYPQRIDYGDLTSYGHEGRVLLISETQVPESLRPGDTFHVKAEFGYLVCEKICVPADVVLSIDIPVTENDGVKDSRWGGLFEEAIAKWPLVVDSVDIRVYETAEHFHIVFPYAHKDSDIEFFASDADVINYSAPQELVAAADGVELILQKSNFITEDITHLNGVLVSERGWGSLEHKAITIHVPIEDAKNFLAASDDASVVVSRGGMSLWGALLFAFIGGLILNLMPCVLPVLSLKVLGLIKHAEDKDKAWMHGWAFTAGVIVAFLILASSLMVLREAGELIGWGFQFQSPGFVIFMCWLLFLLALNLFGVFEIGENLTRLSWIKHHGLSASFLSGMLVTIVATPCTAPFMGAALGFALTQPVIVALLVFAALGFGLALPYLVLTCQPSLLKFVPKPGPWMNKFKFCMGFLLLATALWFLWILDAQLGRTALWVMAAAIGVSAVGAWFLFHGQKKRSGRLKTTAFLILLSGLVIAYQAPRFQEDTQHIDEKSAIQWVDYSPELIDQLRAEDKPVFIDFTAKWCLSCQVNERVALSNDKVIRMVEDKEIVMVKADWTQRDAMITEALESFGKRSIPLYVLYFPGEDDAVFLPEIITPPIVLDAFSKIK